MSLFGFESQEKRYGVIIDIGSGSVLTAIVCSDKQNTHPQIVWSKREHTPLRNIDSLEKSAKVVMTALINMAMILDSEGRKVLHKFDKKAKLTELQCSISAPWSYTVTKTIKYAQKEPFVISDSLIEELLISVQEKVEKELDQNEVFSELGLEIITKDTLGISANGYLITHPEGNKAKNLSITQANVVTQKYLIDSISEVKEKIVPDVSVHKLSFILLFFTVNKDLLARTQDTCLIDITYEATEIGIVRDGMLKYCTHTAFGSFSLAREISAITKIPLDEAFSYLHTEEPMAFTKTLPEKQKKAVAAVFESYIVKLSELFRETGDALSIPRHITLHTEIKTETLFSDLIDKAVKRNIKTSPYIVPISQEIITTIYAEATKETAAEIPTDTALLVSAQFFHTQNKKSAFEYY
jgi:3-methyladenine DNA glycosylase AlkC